VEPREAEKKETTMGRPPSPTLITLGRLVRTHRDAAGMLQRELAGKLGYSDGWLSNLENGVLRPRRDQVTALEQALNLPPGALITVYDQLEGESLPIWFRPWLEEEARATVLRSVQLSLIPGLLQTEEYVRALMPGDEKAVEARIERQQILGREDPPRMHFVIDEAVLYRERGGPEVMRTQLEHLANVISHRVTIQVIRSKDNPFSAGAFTLATVDGSEVAYVETAVRGIVTSAREDIDCLSEVWETIRSFALPQQESIEFVRRVAEERWT
jgi:transcriptional regulator with XRE-family HTH domain